MTKIKGFIAAPFTPFNADLSVNYELIEKQASVLKKNKLAGVFICGTTGESLSLTVKERKKIAARWRQFTDNDFKLIVHVGHNCLKEAQNLAAHAQDIGAYATGAMGPTFFKPSSVKALVDWCRQIAAASPKTPFYYYHIPALTGISVLMHQFLNTAISKIPNLSGVKFTSENFFDFCRCLAIGNGKFDMLFGRDEILLSAFVYGGKGAVGSFYNYLAPTYLKMFQKFKQGNLDEARKLQFWIQEFTEIFLRYGGNVATGKSIMQLIGLNCGPVRLPLINLTAEQCSDFQEELIKIKFLEYSMKY